MDLQGKIRGYNLPTVHSFYALRAENARKLIYRHKRAGVREMGKKINIKIMT
jgi:hypothetical protein